MLTPKQFTFDITAPAELAAGRRGFEDRITVIVDSGDPGGDGDEFAVYLRQALAEWFDAYVALNEDAPSVLSQAEWDALAAERNDATLKQDLQAAQEETFDILRSAQCETCGEYLEPKKDRADYADGTSEMLLVTTCGCVKSIEDLGGRLDAVIAERDALTKLTSDLLAENAGLRDKADRLAAELAALKGE